jgi:hypothetical protein
LALKKNQKYCFGELGNTTGQHSTAQHKTAQHAKLHQASPSFAKLRQASPSFANLRQASPSFAKHRQAISCIGVEENQKYCFGELGNTTSMNLNLIYLFFPLFKAIYSYRMCKSLSNTSFKVN